MVIDCLAKDPEERLQSAHDVKLQLKWIAEGGSHAGVPAPLASQRKTRERMLWAAAALLLAVCVALAVVHFTQTKTGQLHPRVYPAAGKIHVCFCRRPYRSGHDFAGRHAAGVCGPWSGRKADVVAASTRGHVQSAVAGHGGRAYPFWSPDSRFIGFFADGKLKTIEVAGGPAQVLCDAPDGRGGSWNSEGTIVFPPIFNGPLYRISTAGGTPAPVTELDPSQQEDSHRWPQFLPDGRHFLFL